ncbi:MAG: PP2C family protein-serine/threonine phosphatase [Marmoricola sp.]
MTSASFRGGLRLHYTALSDVGRVRKDNQDSGYAGEHLLAVADGVGGSARGDVASSAAIGELRALDVPPGNDLQASLADAIDRAHRKIAELVEQHPELDSTSTTVTAAVFDGTRIGVGHVGDSRGYLLRDGEIAQLTKDHTFVQGLIDEGRITEPESRVHPHRNLILRAVDGVHETEPDLFLVDLLPGDRIMLCSDGASGVLDDPALAAILRTGTVEQAADTLVHDSLEAGSSDNVTVVVADVVQVDAADAADPEETQDIQISPLVVGAAAEKRKGLGRGRTRRRVDTGELAPVPAEPGQQGSPNEGAADPEAIRYAPRPPRRYLWLRWVAGLVVLGVLLWLAGSSAYAWSQKQFYVAPSADHVAIYRGVEADLPIVSLHHVYARTDTLVADLPDYYRGQVSDGMAATNLDDARAIVRRLAGKACATTPSTTPSTTPTPTPTQTPTVKPTTKRQKAKARAARRAAAKASVKASASASPSATPGSGPTDCATAP